MTDYRRLNVSLRRPRDALFVVCDLFAIDNASASDINPETTESDVEATMQESKDFMGKLQDLSRFFKKEKCIVEVDIGTVEECGTRHAAALSFKAKIENTVCFNCRDKGHMSKDCTNEEELMHRGECQR